MSKSGLWSETRDDFVNRAVLAADIPLLRIKAARAYSASEVETQIRARLSAPAAHAAPPQRSDRQ